MSKVCADKIAGFINCFRPKVFCWQVKDLHVTLSKLSENVYRFLK